jgi:hypothetical protein
MKIKGQTTNFADYSINEYSLLILILLFKLFKMTHKQKKEEILEFFVLLDWLYVDGVDYPVGVGSACVLELDVELSV